MKVVVVFIIVAPGLSLQYSNPCNDELDRSREYDHHHHPLYYRVDDQKHRHKKHSSKVPQSAELEISNKRYIQRYTRRRPSKKKPNDCVCDCKKCDKLQQCCELICKECDQSEHSDHSEQKNEVEPQPGPNSGNLVFVPYPYPMMVPPPPIMPAIPIPLPLFANKTFPKTPTEHRIGSTAPSIARYDPLTFGRRQSDLQRDTVLDLLQSLRLRQEYPNVNMRPMKRSQIPDYEGITDQLLDRLIMQRNVKNINSGLPRYK